MNDALRRLVKDGTAGGPAIDSLRRRWQDGAGTLSPEQLANDPAFQRDPLASVTRSASTVEGALAELRATRARMTARPTQKDEAR